MNNKYRLSSIAIVISFIFVARANSGGKIGTILNTALESLKDDDHVIAWVFFTDKGSREQMKSAIPLNVVSERSIRRRLKVRAQSEVVDYADLPVEERYVAELSKHVLRIRQQSKWFNAASVVATKAQIKIVESLPFVNKIDLVWRAKRDNELEQEEPTPSTDALSKADKAAQVYALSYGPSFNQNQQINVPAVHNTGNYAQGVVVGVFDNGFRLLTHQAFDSLRPRIIASYDWVDHKVSVVPNNTSTSFGSHGVNTLSTIGGYWPDSLIGAGLRCIVYPCSNGERQQRNTYRGRQLGGCDRMGGQHWC